MNDVLLSPLRLSELESLIEKSVRRAFNQLSSNTASDTDQFGNFKWLALTTGVPENTLRQWDAAGKIPGSSKFGKHRIYDKQKVLDWLRGGHQSIDMTSINQAAEQQVNQQLAKRKQGRATL